ncbi:MAG TPA: hypothetical protein VGB99_15745 [Acidobacteriota bacterium]
MAISSAQRAQNYRAWMRGLGLLIWVELLALLVGIAFGGWRWSWPPRRDADWLLTIGVLLIATFYAWRRTAVCYARERQPSR